MLRVHSLSGAFLSLRLGCRVAVLRNARLVGARSYSSSNEQNHNESQEAQNQSSQNAEQVDSSELDALRKLVADKEAKMKEAEELFKRSLAEMENVRERARRDVENAKLFGVQKFSKDMIVVADYIGMALGSVPEDKRDDSLIKPFFSGVEMTERELLKVFERNGLERFDPLGEKFDPNWHNALCEVSDASKEPGTVAFVDKKGYKLNGRVIRPAQVGVVRKI